MDLNNLGNCEQNCNKKCYIKLEDGTLIRKLCKEAIGRIYSDCDEIIEHELEKLNISIEKFYELRDTKVKFDTDENKKNAAIIKEIREAIKMPNESDIFEKALPKLDFYKYVETTGRILGFVTLAKYLKNIKTSDDYVKKLALAINISPDNPMYLVRFILMNSKDLIEKLKIPFNEEGIDPQKEPCTGSGFTVSKDENIIAEYIIRESDMGEGSQVFEKMSDGLEKLIGILDRSAGQFIPCNGDIIIKIENKFFKKGRDGNITPIEIDESTTEIVELLP